MQKFESIVTDTFFADGANIAGLMFKLIGYTEAGIPYGEIRSQQLNGNGTPTPSSTTYLLNSKSQRIFVSFGANWIELNC